MTAGTNRLRTLLVRHGVLPPERAEELALEAARDGRFLASVLLRKGVLEEEELLGFLARAANVVPIDLSRVRISKEAVQALPQESAVAYGVLPISKVGRILTLAVANPFDVLVRDDLRLVTGCELRLVVSTEEAIREGIGRAYDPGAEQIQALLGSASEEDGEVAEVEETEDSVDLDALSSEHSPIVKLVNLLLFRALREGASDIHIEPFDDAAYVRTRVDGLLREGPTPPRRLLNAVVSRIKIMARLDIAEKVKPQDGKFQIRYAGRRIDFRVSVLPVMHGEKIVLRVLDSAAVDLSLDGLGFERKALDDFRAAIRRPYGMILVTGPTGSGKSTTLYAAVRELTSVERNIVTVEDPVEYTMPRVNQVPVNPKRGVTFASALRAILRQDPNVILIGEIRDPETIEIAIKAALTGHLVLSTLHTNDAPASITRMLDMGVDPFLVGSSVLLVSAQRLARTLCESCREPVSLPPERLRAMGFLEEEVGEAKLFRPVGCARCHGGYRGRFALLETMPLSEELRRMIVEGRALHEIKAAALAQGMMTLRRCGILNTVRGRTSLEEVLRVTMPD